MPNARKRLSSHSVQDDDIDDAGRGRFFKKRIPNSRGRVQAQDHSINRPGDQNQPSQAIVPHAPAQPDNEQNTNSLEKDHAEYSTDPHERSSPPTNAASNKKGRAEKRFSDAATKLSNTISKLSHKITIPEEISFQNSGRIDDVEATAGKLEVALDALIDKFKNPQANPEGRNTVKQIAKAWFKVSYPYITPCLTQAKDVIPSPYGVVITGVLFLLQVVNDNICRTDDIKSTLSFLLDSLQRIRVTEGFSEVLKEKELEDIYCAALNLSAAVSDYLALAMKYLIDANFVKRTIASHSKFTSARDDITKAVNEFTGSMGYLTGRVGVELLRNDQKDKRQKVLDWVWKGNYWRRHEDLRDRRVPGTGRWFLERIDSWMHGEESMPLICSGIPGAGKSFMTSIVVDKLILLTNNLNSERVAVTFFYFDYTDPLNQTSEDIIAAILKQLIYQMPSLLPEIESAYDRCMQKGPEARPDRDSLVQLIKQCTRQFDRTFVVIDAMDECNERQRSKLLSCLQQLVHAGSVKMFITNRPHIINEIRANISGGSVDIEAKRDEVEAYLRAELKGKSPQLHHTLSEKIVTRVGAKSDGQYSPPRSSLIDRFLLAEFQLGFVLDKYNPRDMADALENLPKTLPDAYGEIMKRIDKKGHGAKTIALKALSWIFHAKRPLHIEELVELLLVRWGDRALSEEYRMPAADVIDCCQSLIIYNPISGIVEFSHYTVQEYFRSNVVGLAPVAELAVGCLAYIKLDEFAIGPCTNSGDLNLRRQTHRAIQSVAEFWGDFVREVEDVSFVQERTLIALADQGRRDAIVQLVCAGAQPWRDPKHFPAGRTVLSLLAGVGLAKICAAVLNNRQRFRLEAGNPELLGSLSSTEVDIARKDVAGMTALHYAARDGHDKVVEILLAANANVEAQDNHGCTALQCAASGGHDKVVEILLKTANANVEARDNDGGTALHRAAGIGHDKVVEILLKTANANVEAQDNIGWTVLHRAAKNGHDKVVEILLAANANVEAQDNNGGTALHRAAGIGHDKVVEILLKTANANVEAQDNDGWTALHAAAENGHDKVVEILLAANANVEAQDNDGWTALHGAAGIGHDKVVEILLAANANVEAQNNDGWTALHRAAENGHDKVVEILLAANANVEAQDNDGITALHCAAENGHDTVVEILLAANANVEAQDNYGWTALHRAALDGRDEVVEILLAVNTNVEAQDNDGWTALHCAAENGDDTVVEILLAANANVEAQNNDGRTASDYAAANGHEAVVQLLTGRRIVADKKS